MKIEKRVNLYAFEVEYIDQREAKPRTVRRETVVLDGGRVSALELGQQYTRTELAPSSQALAKAIAEIEPLLWERDAIKHWVCGNGSAGKKHAFKMNRTDNTDETPPSEQLSLKT